MYLTFKFVYYYFMKICAVCFRCGNALSFFFASSEETPVEGRGSCSSSAH